MCNVSIVTLLGLPGIGKSTFTQNFGQWVQEHGANDFMLWVLSVDEVERKLRVNRGLSATHSGEWTVEDAKIWKLSQDTVLCGLLQKVKKLKNLSLAEKPVELPWKCYKRSDQDGKNSVIIIDDNFYYRSMRHNMYAVARDMMSGFAQIMMSGTAELASARNMSRSAKYQVPDNVIRRMSDLFEKPKLDGDGWEASSCLIHFDETNTSFSVHCPFLNTREWNQPDPFSMVYEVLQVTLCNPVMEAVELERVEQAAEESRRITEQDFAHQLDVAIRKKVSKLIQEFKCMVPKHKLVEVVQSITKSKVRFTATCKGIDAQTLGSIFRFSCQSSDKKEILRALVVVFERDARSEIYSILGGNLDGSTLVERDNSNNDASLDALSKQKLLQGGDTQKMKATKFATSASNSQDAVDTKPGSQHKLCFNIEELWTRPSLYHFESAPETHTGFSWSACHFQTSDGKCQVPPGHTAFSWNPATPGVDQLSASEKVPFEPLGFQGWDIFVADCGYSKFGLPCDQLLQDWHPHPLDPRVREPMSYYFFILRPPPELQCGIVLMDCCFNLTSQASAFRIENFRKPCDVLKLVGIQPGDVEHVILSHCHWDHSGGIASFPDATIWLREAEYLWLKQQAGTPKGAASWCASVGLRDPRGSICAGGICPSDLHYLERARAQGKLRLVPGSERAEILPGIHTFASGTHTPGSQWVVVESANRRKVVLASDNAYLYANIEQERSIGPRSCGSTAANLAAIKHMKRVAQGNTRTNPPGFVVPGHDPKVFERFPEVWGGSRVHEICVTPRFETRFAAKLSWMHPLNCANGATARLMNAPKQVPEVNGDIDPITYKRDHVARGVPLVVRMASCLQTYDAMSKWSLKYLKDAAGTNPVTVRKETNKETYRNGKRIAMHVMPLSEYIERIEQRTGAENYYLAACNFKKALPQVARDFSPPRLLVDQLHSGPFLWIARAKHYEFCHCDPDDGLLVMMSGQKTIRLHSPQFVNQMYPNPLGSCGKTVQSQVVHHTDSLEEEGDPFPKFRNLPYLQTTIRAGDALYIPAFWWHQVVSDEVSISVNVFWGNKSRDLSLGMLSYVDKVLSIARPAFERWFLNIVEQNRPFQSFGRLLADLDRQIALFLFKQWHQVLMPYQVLSIRQRVLEYLSLTRRESDVFYSLGDISKEENRLKLSTLATASKPSLLLKVRGLRHRKMPTQ